MLVPKDGGEGNGGWGKLGGEVKMGRGGKRQVPPVAQKKKKKPQKGGKGPQAVRGVKKKKKILIGEAEHGAHWKKKPKQKKQISGRGGVPPGERGP